jgi:ComEC/Rec2-related protein
MRFRVFLLLFLLALRLLPGWIEVGRYKSGDRLHLRGKVIKIEQRMSECVGVVGRFWVRIKSECKFSQYNKVDLIGRVELGLIDRFLGRVWLDVSQENTKTIRVEKKRVGHFSYKLLFERWREKLAVVYRKLLPEPEASLVAGVVLGYKRLPYEFYRQLINSGTVHIIVASGYNVMIVGEMVLLSLFYIMVRQKAGIAAIGAMFLYALLSGFDPPVVRAVIMGAVLIIGSVLGRVSGSFWGLFVAVWLMLMVEPVVLLSLSFQLSVMASIGLMILAPKLREFLQKRWKESFLLFLLKTELVPTLSVQIMTVPLIWWYFGRVAWIAPLSNMLVLPLVPVLMFLGGVLLVLGLVWLPLGFIVAWAVYALAHLMVVLVGWFG